MGADISYKLTFLDQISFSDWPLNLKTPISRNKKFPGYFIVELLLYVEVVTSEITVVKIDDNPVGNRKDRCSRIEKKINPVTASAR